MIVDISLKWLTFEVIALAQFHIDKNSPAYIKNMYSLLNQAFDTAVEWNLIKENPIKNIKKPLVRKGSKIDKSWSKDEINTFLHEASKRGIAVPYLVSIHTGIRRGELLGLTWDDVDQEFGTIRINKSVYRIRGEELKIGSTKMENSVRTIPLPKYLMEILMKHKDCSRFSKRSVR